VSINSVVHGPTRERKRDKSGVGNGTHVEILVRLCFVAHSLAAAALPHLFSAAILIVRGQWLLLLRTGGQSSTLSEDGSLIVS
jgi:hypothetical protein